MCLGSVTLALGPGSPLSAPWSAEGAGGGPDPAVWAAMTVWPGTQIPVPRSARVPDEVPEDPEPQVSG